MALLNVLFRDGDLKDGVGEVQNDFIGVFLFSLLQPGETETVPPGVLLLIICRSLQGLDAY